MKVHRSHVRFETEVPAQLHVPDRPDGSLVVALHGMGQSADGFAREALPCVPDRTTLLVPQGPYPYEFRRRGSAEPPRQGNAWYVYTGDQAEFVRSMEKVEDWLLQLVEQQVRTAPEVARVGIDSRRMALLGFSQGGYVAGFVGIRNPRWFRALVVAAGRIKDEVLADAAPHAAAAGLRVLDVHGNQDASMGADACRASADRIAAHGVEVDFRTYPAGHAVLRDESCRYDVRAFLADSFA